MRVERFLKICAVCALLGGAALAEEQEFVELSLEDLMNVEVTTASRKSETLFNAPVSTFRLSRSEIRNSGATNLPEIFRMIPGLFVRELYNGVFDIHIRGGNNLPSSNFNNVPANTILLVVDGRVVYNYFNGGVVLHTIPVSIQDIDSVEVVRGPAAALYGPNAATGVIHIKTTALKAKDGFETRINPVWGGTTQNASLSRQVYASTSYQDESMFLQLSGHLIDRERDSSEYFDSFTDRFVDDISQGTFDGVIPYGQEYANSRWPDPTLALESENLKLLSKFRLGEDTELSLSGGLNHAEAQNILFDGGGTPTSPFDHDEWWFNSNFSSGDFVMQFSYAEFDEVVPPADIRLASDFKQIELNAQYQFDLGWFEAIPVLEYRSVERINSATAGGAQDKFYLNSQSGGLRIEKSFENGLTLFATGRLDHFEFNDTFYESHLFGATYSPHEKLSWRASSGRAYRTPFFGERFTFLFLPPGASGVFPEGIAFQGDIFLDPVQVDTSEIGVKYLATEWLSVDADVFYSEYSDYNNFYVNPSNSTFTQGQFTVPLSRFYNIPLEAQQIGGTVSATFNFADVKIRAYTTVQYTDRDGGYGVDFQGINDRSGKHDDTPELFGGGNLTYRLNDKLDFYGQLYYFSSNTFSHRRFQSEQKIDTQMIGQFKLGYKVSDEIRTSLILDNLTIFGSERQTPVTDALDPRLYLGLELIL